LSLLRIAILSETNRNFTASASEFLTDAYNALFAKIDDAIGTTTVDAATLSSTRTRPRRPRMTSANDIVENESLYVDTDYLATQTPSYTDWLTLDADSDDTTTVASTTTTSNPLAARLADIGLRLRAELSVDDLSRSQRRYVILVLEIIREVYNGSAARTTSMRDNSSEAIQITGSVTSCGNVTRTVPANMATMNAFMTSSTSAMTSLSNNDRTLAAGITRSAQALTSFTNNWGNRSATGNAPNFALPIPETPGGKVSLYPFVPITGTVTIPIVVPSTTGRPPVVTTAAVNANPTLTANEQAAIEQGINMAIADAQNRLQIITTEYTAAVNAGTVTTQQTTAYFAAVDVINARIDLLNRELAAVSSTTTVTGFEAIGERIGASPAGRVTHSIFGGIPNLNGVPPNIKHQLQQILGHMFITTPSSMGIVNPVIGPGVLSAMSVMASASGGGDTITVVSNAIIQDTPFSVKYDISTHHLRMFLDYYVSMLTSSDFENTQNYNNCLIFIYSVIAFAVYARLYRTNHFNHHSSSMNMRNVISTLAPMNLTEFSTNVIPNRSLFMYQDSRAVINSAADGTVWTPQLYGGSRILSKRFDPVAYSNSIETDSFKRIMGIQ
jgi:hypothetical protein